MAKIIFFVGFIFLSSGCQPGEKTKEKAEEKNAESASGSLPSPAVTPEAKNLLPKLYPLSEPNRYRIEIDIPPSLKIPNTEWVVERFGEKEQSRKTIPLLSGESRIIDEQISSGETYAYRLISLSGADVPVSNEVKITIPQDVEVKDRVEAESILHFHRLFLRRGSFLVTHGRNFSIDVDEIISEDGTLETFSTLDHAAEGAAGRPGGTIVIRAKKGSGVLRIIGRGETGGRGVAGAAGKMGDKGAKGNAARTELIYQSTNAIYRDNLPKMVEEVESKLSAEDPFWKEVYRCVDPPGRGQTGLPGFPGGKGGTGGTGGDSARIYVEIANASGIQIAPLSLPGEGGPGGPAGKGGKGGEGGAPGDLDRHKLCQVGHPGPVGQDGIVGEAGEPGARGNILPQCLILGMARFGDCDPLKWEPFLGRR